MLYFAYGMNTSLYEMSNRCPAAVSQGRARLLNASFRFADHADIINHKNSDVDGVLWEITDACLRSLDKLEGYPYYYNRREFEVEHNGDIKTAIAYFMQPGKQDYPPSQYYVDMLVEGYGEHGVPLTQIENAIEMCYEH
jgi:gamma-glutamylcyclotransferase (GGCT)/AIG2-like uncharacterized protein YtfP